MFVFFLVPNTINAATKISSGTENEYNYEIYEDNGEKYARLTRYSGKEKNITINVLKDKDITYMWYMEMKRRKNKSFDYHISDDYEELFRDVVDNE